MNYVLGIYLPLLWEPTFCWKSPIALGYTRGHFTALVALEPETEDVLGAGANTRSGDDLRVIFLPLMTVDHQRLPVHFLTQEEVRSVSVKKFLTFDCLDVYLILIT